MKKNIKINKLACCRQGRLLFSDISEELRSGEILIIEGPNGAGKSSLLRLIAGLALPLAGEIYWRDLPITTQRHTYLAQLHFVSHQNGIQLGLTVAENLLLASCLAQQPLNEVNEVLEMLALKPYQSILVSDLSAGQKRRVALAKLFLLTKALWILDEPLTALDQPMQQFFLAKLEDYLASGGIIIMSSHHEISLKHHQAKRLKLGEVAAC